MKPVDKENTINKSTLLNWLYSADKELAFSELGRWIESKTGGRYTLVKKEQEKLTLPIIENLNNKVSK